MDHLLDAGKVFQGGHDLRGGTPDFQLLPGAVTQLTGEVFRRITGDNLALVNNDDPLAELTDFGEDVTAQDDGVVSG